jgi:lipid-binding SYLF domain-containing protein
MTMSFLRTKRLAFATALVVAVLGATRARAATDDKLISEARQTVDSYRKIDAGLDSFLRHAAGYAVFPGVGKGGYWVGGAHGTGVVFENGAPHGAPVGKVTLNQVTVGPQIGGQEYSEVIVFETPRALAEFKQGKAAFSAQTSAVALSAGASAIAKYERGVAIFTSMKGGLMAEASIGGQKFSYEPFAPRR